MRFQSIITFLMLGLSAFSCSKENLLPAAPTAAVVTATVNKVTTQDSVNVFINHPYTLTVMDTSHVTGSIAWGDGNVTNFNNPATGSINYFHGYLSPGLYSIIITINKPSAPSTFTMAFKGSAKIDTLLSVTGLEGMPQLWAFVFQDTRLKTLNISNNPSLKSLWFRNCSLPVADINAMLIALDAETITGSTIPYIQIDSQLPAAAPTGAGLVAKQNLLNKRWTVQTD